MNVVKRGQLPPSRLVDSDAIEHGRELVTILGIVNRGGRCTEYGHVGGVKTGGKVVGNLTAHRQYHSVRLLKVENIHNSLVGELVEVEPVAHVIVGRHRFGIVVDHYRTPALALNSHQRIDRAPVKLNRATDAVGSRAEHHNRLVVMQILDIIGRCIVGHIQIVGLGRIFSAQRVNLLHHRDNAKALAHSTHHIRCLVR